jgi:hypothetical protein
MVNPVKDTYEHGECPDCGEPIPDTVQAGDECVNCGHVFCESTADDDQPETNVQRVTRLMEFGSPLMQAFVVEAIAKYAALCLQKDAAFFDSGFMNGKAWIDCAKRAKEWSDTYYGRTGVERPISAEQV